MNKILLIIQREYLSRVRKKSFILMTFLVPILFIGMYGLIIYFVMNSDEMADKKTVIVADDSGLFKNKMENTASIKFQYATNSYADEKQKLTKSEDEQLYLLHIPADVKNVELLSAKKSGASTISAVENQLSTVMQNERLRNAGIDTAVLAKAQEHIDVSAKQITAEGEKDAGTFMAYGIGFVTALLIYMSLFIYGAQVMRGVIEEKTSRIVEVIISSVKPFQLMLGKIIGIGMVGLTQFLLWIILTIGLTTVGSAVLMNGQKMDKNKTEALMKSTTSGAAMSAANGGTEITMTAGSKQEMGMKIMQQLNAVPIAYTVTMFLFYFLFGYLLYSAIFAAVGSAVDNETETQQFMLPVTLPLIFTFILSMNFVINNPDSNISFWLSVIPFTAPIAMMIRIPFGVPVWQLALSMSLMVAGFLFTTWLAARIYRVGILMYGKKVNYRELGKWLFYKE
ncbi:ABC transporter permease [Taibaiella soli]|uniref:ABC transporter permease n=1 Tax=Taibaiella soli TaxID=1649169 RepID=A0A2W2AUW9_9BACT|nr:ABC transporter permease [Taibaiella soli]PZF71478.1 ABC transporter permease [Taibaiella soli]